MQQYSFHIYTPYNYDQDHIAYLTVVKTPSIDPRVRVGVVELDSGRDEMSAMFGGHHIYGENEAAKTASAWTRDLRRDWAR